MTQRVSSYGVAIALLLTVLCLPAMAGTQASVTGVVRDAQGAPQIGALIELLRPDLSVAATTFTDDRGRYILPQVRPGIYGLKATGSLFLPTLRENLQLLASSHAVVNLTLNTLFEAFRWLPAQARPADEPKDDWTWTLRLSSNRPLLRMLEDGPLVVVTDGGAPALKARVTVRGGAGGFGDGGLHHDFEMERAHDDDAQLIFRADLSQAPTAVQSTALSTMMGYERQIAPGRNMISVAALELRPDIRSGHGQQGLESVLLRTAETMDPMEGVHVEVGSELAGVHTDRSILANRPFASATIHAGKSTEIAYRFATAPDVQRAGQMDRNTSVTRSVAEKGGRLVLEHGAHNEVAVKHTEGRVEWQAAAFHDRVENPVLNGGGDISAATWSSGDLLFDPATGLLRTSAADYSGAGLLGEISGNLDGNTLLSFSYAVSQALAMDSGADPLPAQVTIHEGVMNLRPRTTQMYAVQMSGKTAHGGAHWRASYRWQPASSMTPVALFNTSLPAPYLSLFLRQPIRVHHVLPNGFEALVDVRNLLAQGYRPFVTSDGSTLYFAQAERSMQCGLSFSF